MKFLYFLFLYSFVLSLFVNIVSKIRKLWRLPNFSIFIILLFIFRFSFHSKILILVSRISSKYSCILSPSNEIFQDLLVFYLRWLENYTQLEIIILDFLFSFCNKYEYIFGTKSFVQNVLLECKWEAFLHSLMSSFSFDSTY